MKRKNVLFMVLFIFVFIPFLSADITKPEKILGFKVGTDRKLADMHQIVEYFNKLDRESDRIQVKEVGKTTLGNPFIVALITSVENQIDIKKYHDYQIDLADPRKINEVRAEEAINKGKSVVMINCSLHASEIGASQMSMELAYDLASKNDSKTREILDNVIILLVPMHNPDGIQMVVDWYRKYVGTEYEGCPMPWLYHKYVGHDNNRDWYMFTQVESKLTINKIHNVWHPQIVMDMHQMGSRGPRIFVPPFVDPYEPNIDPIIQQQVSVMGSFIASEMTAEGKSGVGHSMWFDAWTPARAYHHYHGGIRILTEVASVNVATPLEIELNQLYPTFRKRSVKMPMPWQGGEWTLRDIVDYDYSAVMAVLINAARLRENWLRNFYRVHKKAVQRIEPPFAFIIPKTQRDASTAFKMMDVLNIGDIEIHKAQEPFEAQGVQYSEGTFIIFMAQPYGGFAKTLLERQDYPEIREYPGGPLKVPYDVVAHTLPLLMGVNVVQVDKPFKVQCEKMEDFRNPRGMVELKEDPYGYIWGHETNDDTVALNRLIQKGYSVSWSAESFKENGIKYPPGSMIIEFKKGLNKELKSIIEDLTVQFKAINFNPNVEEYQLKPVRLGVYKSWKASMDEGWLRWVLEQYEFPFRSVCNEDIKSGNLNQDIDVMIIPDMRERTIMKGISVNRIPSEYAGGIGENGLSNLKLFVKKGGTLIALNSASSFLIEQFDLDINDPVKDLGRNKFFIPGSILRIHIDNNHPIAFGYKSQGAVMFRRSPGFEVKKGNSVVQYPPEDLLLSGWIDGEDHLSGKSGIVDIPYDSGKLILLGFPVHYRGQAHATFRFLFNSIYYGSAELDK
ncbi:MAG: M14 family zinc carboxypeptidase [Candidatus Aminicenantaceae bacterium]